MRHTLLITGYWRKDKEGIEVTGRRGRRLRNLLDNFKERRWWYSHLKQEVLDRNVWRVRFGRGFETVVRETINEWIFYYILYDILYIFIYVLYFYIIYIYVIYLYIIYLSILCILYILYILIYYIFIFIYYIHHTTKMTIRFVPATRLLIILLGAIL